MDHSPEDTDSDAPLVSLLLWGLCGAFVGLVFGWAATGVSPNQPAMPILLAGWIIGCFTGGTIGHFIGRDGTRRTKVFGVFIFLGSLARLATFYLNYHTPLGEMDRGDLAQKQGQYRQAIDHYTRALGIDPKCDAAYRQRAACLINLKKLDEALADLDRALRLDSSQAILHSVKAEILVELKRDEEALAALNAGLELDPRQADALSLRGQIRLGVKDFAGAAEDYTNAIDLGTKAKPARFNRGLCWWHLGQYAKAVEDASAYLRTEPDNAADVHELRGGSYHRLGDQVHALQDYDALLRARPEYGRGYYLRGLLRTEMNQPDKALEDFAKAIQRGFREQGVFEKRGDIYFHRRDFPHASAEYAEELRINPTCLGARCNRGAALAFSKKYPEAVVELTEALKLDAKNVEARANRAICYRETSRFELGLADATEIVRLRPNWADGYRLRAEMHEGLGHEQEAVADRRKARELGNDR